MPWNIPIDKVIEGGAKIYEHRNEIARTARQLLSLISDGVLRIVVVGVGGVGKSELGYFFSPDPDKNPDKNPPRVYAPSRKIDPVNLGDAWGGLLIVPGQHKYFPEDWTKILGYVAGGKSRIVINVVAWGYHTIAFPVGYQDVKDKNGQATLCPPGGGIADFLGVYLPAARTWEEEQLKLLEAPLVAAPDSVRMLTLITKQDLWWPHQADVEKHYEQGLYGQTIRAIGEARAKLGRSFLHEYLPVSLVSRNLWDGKRNVLAETSAGYDLDIQQAYQALLIRIVRDYEKR